MIENLSELEFEYPPKNLTTIDQKIKFCNAKRKEFFNLNDYLIEFQDALEQILDLPSFVKNALASSELWPAGINQNLNYKIDSLIGKLGDLQDRYDEAIDQLEEQKKDLFTQVVKNKLITKLKTKSPEETANYIVKELDKKRSKLSI